MQKRHAAVGVLTTLFLLLTATLVSSAAPTQAGSSIGDQAVGLQAARVRLAGLQPADRRSAGLQTATFTSVKDTSANETLPGSAHGGRSEMLVGGPSGRRKFAYVQFDLSSLPAGAVVRRVVKKDGHEALSRAGFGRYKTSHVICSLALPSSHLLSPGKQF